jgi:hypothetical protein
MIVFFIDVVAVVTDDNVLIKITPRSSSTYFEVDNEDLEI